MSNNLPTAEIILDQCKKEVSHKYRVGNTLVMGHREKYWNEAAIKAIHRFASLVLDEAGERVCKKLLKQNGISDGQVDNIIEQIKNELTKPH